MKEKTIVLSMDAMVGEDIEYLKTKPNFSRLFEKRVQVGKMCTIYPSITYPAHVSMMTGCRPGKHGIITNGKFKTTLGNVDWHLYNHELQVEDIFAAAKRAGCTTASVYWPVTGCNPNVDYLINEFFFYGNEPVEETFAAMGTNEVTMEIVRENMDRWPTEPGGNGNNKLYLHNTYDAFIMGCMCSLIRKHQPDLLLAHNCWFDSLRHRNGVFNELVREGLDQMDLWFGELIEALEDAGVYEQTNFVLVSDHGQRDFVRRIKVNTLLRRGGFVDANQEEVLDWRAYGQSNGMSATIFLKDPDDKELWQQVYDYLQALAADGVWGFNKVYTEQEARERYGMYGGFAFMLESDGYTSFAESWREPVIHPVDLTDYRLGKATHGYEPEKGAQPVFVARGPAFRDGAYLENAWVIDEAPTIARIWGQTMPQAEGRVLAELLAEGR